MLRLLRAPAASADLVSITKQAGNAPPPVMEADLYAWLWTCNYQLNSACGTYGCYNGSNSSSIYINPPKS